MVSLCRIEGLGIRNLGSLEAKPVTKAKEPRAAKLSSTITMALSGPSPEASPWV